MGFKKIFIVCAVSAAALFATACTNDYGENLESVLNAKTEATTITANVTVPARTDAETSEEEISVAEEVIETTEEETTEPTEPETEAAVLLKTDTYYWSEYIDDPSTLMAPYNPDSWLRYDFIMDSAQHITLKKMEDTASRRYEFDIESIEGNVYTLTNGVLNVPHGMMGYDTEYGFTGTIKVNDDGTFHMTINEVDGFDWDFELKP